MLELFSFGANGWGDELLRGTLMTLAAAASSFALAGVIGTVAALASEGRSRFWRIGVSAYTTLARGVPELLIIYLLFFGGGQFIRNMTSEGGSGLSFDPIAFGAGVLAIGLVGGAYITEVMRGALRAIDKGQIEAARAFGWRRANAFHRIVLPQLLSIALPSLGNVWLSILKDTALLSVVGLIEIMRVANVATGSTRMPLEFYGAAIALYLGLSAASNAIIGRMETAFGRGVRRATR